MEFSHVSGRMVSAKSAGDSEMILFLLENGTLSFYNRDMIGPPPLIIILEYRLPFVVKSLFKKFTVANSPLTSYIFQAKK